MYIHTTFNAYNRSHSTEARVLCVRMCSVSVYVMCVCMYVCMCVCVSPARDLHI